MERQASGNRIGWIVAFGALTVFLVGAFYFAAVATGLTQLDGSSDTLLWLAVVTLFTVGPLYMVASATRQMSLPFIVPLLPLVSLAAWAFSTARFYSYDDYAWPTLVRISEASGVSNRWVVLLFLLAAGAALAAWRRPRIGLLVQGLYLWIVLVWLILVGPYH